MRQTLTLVGVLQRVIVRNRTPWAPRLGARIEVDFFLELDRPEGTRPSPWLHAAVCHDELLWFYSDEDPDEAEAARLAHPGDRVEIVGSWDLCYCSDGRGNLGTARVFLVDDLQVLRG